MGFVEFFSILAFFLMVLIFYTFFKIFIGSTTYEVGGATSSIEGYESLLSVMRTNIEVDEQQVTIAELMALANQDKDKRPLLEKTLVSIMDETYGTSNCVVICINTEKIKGNGCGAYQVYECPTNYIIIPGYDRIPIEVSFESGSKPLSSVRIP